MLFKSYFNPFTGKLQKIFDGTIVAIKGGVTTRNDLPLSGNSRGDARISSDDGHMHIWISDSSSGTLSDWDNQGDIIDILWASISGKPSSDPTDIDDAVSKKHNHANKSLLDTYTQTETDLADAVSKKHEHSNKTLLDSYDQTNVNLSDAVSKKHTQDTDQKLDEGGSDEVAVSEVDTAIYNIIAKEFRFAILNSLAKYNIIDGIVDSYEDESAVDNVASTNEYYYSADKKYGPDQGISDNYKLILSLNGADGATETEDRSNSAHPITFVGGAELDTAQKKWGTASFLSSDRLSGDYLSIPDSADWDVFSATETEWTIDFWIKLSSTSDFQYPMAQYEDADNRWMMYHYPTNGISLMLKSGASNIISMTSNDDGKITDNDWHHVMLYRNGSTYGIYVDGIQSSYLSDASTDTFTGPLYISYNGAAGINGWMDEVRIYKGNLFGANPDAGLTDTITVPTAETPSNPTNLTLISETFTAKAEASVARIALLEEDVDSITLNTDLLLYVTRDGGTTWSQITLTEVADYDANKRILVGKVDISGQPSGTSMEYKVVTANLKNLYIHATAVVWA